QHVPEYFPPRDFQEDISLVKQQAISRMRGETASDYSTKTLEEIESRAADWERRHDGTLSRQRRESFTSSSGREIRTLYTPADLPGFSYLDDLGFPGDPPFTRGESAAG